MIRGCRLLVLAAVVAGAALAGLSGQAVAQAGDVTVFAASSLNTALDDVIREWRRDTGKNVVVSYAASSVLAKQIEQGAPADVFISADEDWMDYLGQQHLIDVATRRDLLGNALVLVTERKSPIPPLVLSRTADLKALLGGGRLAIADTNAVPAGKYAKAALESLGLWESVRDRLAQAENVRAALILVSRGEAPLGVVYGTDAFADSNVRVVATFPRSSHPPIRYPMALTAHARSPDAAAFAGFVVSEKARPLFEKQGFLFLD